MSAPAPPPLEAYGQMPAIEMVTLSPSGGRAALVVRDDKRTEVYARQVGGPVLMAAPVNEGFVDDLRWAGEDVVLVQLSNVIDQYGHSWVAADPFALDLTTHKATQVFANTAEMLPQISDSFGLRDLQSGWFGFYGTLACPIGSPCQRSLYKVDLQSGRPVMLDHADTGPPWSGEPQTVLQWLVSASGDVTARLIYDERNSHWTLQSMKGGKTLSEGEAGFDGVGLWGFGRDAQSAAFVTRAPDGFYTLFEAPLAGGAPPTALSQGQEVLGEWTDPVDGRLIGYRWADDTWHDVMFDPEAQARVDAVHAAFPKKLVRIVSASRDFSRVVAYTDGGDESGAYWLVDFKTDQATKLGSAYPGVPPAATGPVSVFSYKAADGLPLEGVLTLPPGRDPKRLPLLVLAHGGPAARERPGFDWLAQAFASRGYAVLAPNYRGSSGFGKAFRDAGFDQWGRRMQTDVSDGVAALAAAGVIDPKRVCILGLDYGGYAAVAGVTLQHGLYRCAVSYWGEFDLADLFEHHIAGPNRIETKYWATFIGVGQPGTDLGALSPVKHAAAVDAPVLLITTKPDWTRLIDESPAMEQALRQAGKTVDLTRIDSTDSRLRSAAERTALLKAAVPFVEKYDPADGD
ncbi:MAG TPA: prolyl oligopeptidase family serine peptidase [Caulobacteraceae bacterium]